MSYRARNYIKDGEPQYRAILRHKDGSVVIGPYPTIGPARAAATRLKRYWVKGEISVETCTPEWKPVEQ